MTTDEIAAAIEANMPGVTPGEWEWVHEAGIANFHTSIYSEGYKGLLIACGDQNGEHTEDMLHIALCNPANMFALLSERKAMLDEIGLLREYYEARENIARVGLFDATSAQWDRLNTITEALKDRSAA